MTGESSIGRRAVTEVWNPGYNQARCAVAYRHGVEEQSDEQDDEEQQENPQDQPLVLPPDDVAQGFQWIGEPQEGSRWTAENK